MDLSALIFVALAVAWAVYLVPKALKHHEEVAETRTVDRFSHTMRVLARREPVDHKSARLVVTPGRTPAPAADPAASSAASSAIGADAPEEVPVEVAVETTVAVTRPLSAQARRAAAVRATKRRRRVLATLTLGLLTVTTLAIVGVISGWYVVLPATLIVAWLVACRLMVRQEQSERRGATRPTPAPVTAPVTTVATVDPETGEIRVVPAAPTSGPEEAGAAADAAVVTSQVSLDPSLWDPVPVTLPTYVTKPAATRRTVRTIDLDDTGVWTSGRTDADSQIAREAHQADQAQRAERRADNGSGDGHRAVGT